MDATLATAVRVVEDVQRPYLDNLRKALRTWPEDGVERLLVDYGSAPAFAADLADLARLHGLRLLRVEAMRWSRSRALNVAVRAAAGDFFLPVDADCLLPPSYVAAHVGACRWASSPTVTYAVVRRLRSSEPTTHAEACASPGVVVLAGWSHCCLSAGWLRRVRGFNEGFALWGKEDDELLHRAQMDGHRLVGLDGVTPQHLAHPKMQEWAGSAENAGVLAAWQANERLFVETLETRRIVAPQESWGVG
jgi:hypothetical protein